LDFTFKTDYGFVFIIIPLILAGVISYFYYKKTRLENFQKKLFTFLRFLSLFFLFLLLLSPVVSFIKKITEDPVNVFLIDNSESLLLENRDAKIKEIIAEKIKVSVNAENLFFLYSENLYREIELKDLQNIPFTGINNFKTNLTQSIYSLPGRLSGKNLSSVTIVSDGIINEGGNPVTAVKTLNVPFNYILTGDTIQKNDLVLKNIFYNKTAFIESNVPVKLEINSFNYDRDIKIDLYEEDKLLDTRYVKVEKGKNSYEASFNVQSNTEKIVKYKIGIEGAEDEITLKNNYSEIFIKFVSNKFKVLAIAGGPGADFAFIKEELLKINNFETSFLTQKSGSEFYEGAAGDLGSYDAFIFIGYPTQVTNPLILNEVREQLDKRNASLIMFTSRDMDMQKLSLFENKLPMKIGGISDREEETGIKTFASLKNEIFKNGELISSINSFPNIFKTSTSFLINSSAETLLLMGRNSEPAFVIQNTDKNRSAAFLPYGVYKWRLSPAKNNAREVLNYLLTTSVVAITDKKENKNFVIETTKSVYSKFEDVEFQARITNFEIQGGEKILVKISGNGISKELELTKKENKYYEGKINIESDGNYEYKAELISKDNVAESVQNRFAIGENNFEYRLTRADNSVLNSLKNATGGRNFSGLNSDGINEALLNFDEKARSEFRSKRNFELNVNPYFLAAVILLMCLEWFVRKRNSLP